MSYFSPQGAPIAEAVGEYFGRPPVAMAFKDGVFGRQLDENTPGPLTAHRDGSLGGPLYINGELVPQPVIIRHSGGGEELEGGGILGAGAEPTSEPYGPELAPGPIDAYRDGILGAPPYAVPMPGATRAYREGIIGAPPYHEPAAFSLPVSGLGATAATVLDLTDPAVVKELKLAIAWSWGEPLSEVGQQTWDAAFYDDPIWGAKATQLLNGWVDFILAHPNTAAGTTRQLLVLDTAKGAYPSPVGINAIILTGVGAPVAVNVNFERDFPHLFAWRTALLGGAAASDFELLPPYFSEAERLAGASGVSMSTVALVGLGAVGLIGAAVVFGRRRKSR
jgi:hypothetical protein